MNRWRAVEQAPAHYLTTIEQIGRFATFPPGDDAASLTVASTTSTVFST